MTPFINLFIFWGQRCYEIIGALYCHDTSNTSLKMICANTCEVSLRGHFGFLSIFSSSEVDY